MQHLQRFLSRKFFLAAFATIVATIALFTSFLDGNQWITAQSLILGLWGATSVADKKLPSK